MTGEFEVLISGGDWRLMAGLIFIFVVIIRKYNSTSSLRGVGGEVKFGPDGFHKECVRPRLINKIVLRKYFEPPSVTKLAT